MDVSSCIMRDEGGFCDEQAPRCRSALRIIGCLLRTWDMGSIRSKAGQRGKDDTVLKRHPANLDGLEERRCLLRGAHGWCGSERAAVGREALCDSELLGLHAGSICSQGIREICNRDQ